MKKLLLFIILLLALTGCSNGGSQADDSNDLELVDGVNIPTTNNINVSEEITSYEDLLATTIEYAYNATICVLNYQTIKTTYIINNGPWPSYSTKEEHKLYGMGSGVIYYKALTTDGDYLYKVITRINFNCNWRFNDRILVESREL